MSRIIPQGPFFDVEEREHFPFVPTLRQTWREIREEMLTLPEDGFHTWPTEVGNAVGWQLYPLHVYGETLFEAERACPITLAACSMVPGLVSAAFSRMPAGAHIPPHRGFSDAILRCHLALDIPEGCSLTIDRQERRWREGDVWIFDDNVEHEAHNRGSRTRTVLIVDFLRPYSMAESRLRLLVKRLRLRMRQGRSTAVQAREQYKAALASGRRPRLRPQAMKRS